MKQRDRESDSQEELVKKVVNDEAKVGLLLISLIRDIDQQALRGNRLIYTTAKTQTQDFFMKDPRVEVPKSKPLESKSLASSHTKQSDSFKKVQKEKKKKWQKEKQNKKQDLIPATRVNMTNTAGRQKKQKKKSNQTLGNISDITYYNCNKKGYYVNTYPESSKNKCQS